MYVYTLKPDVLASAASLCHSADAIRGALTLAGVSASLIENLLTGDFDAATERLARDHGFYVRRHREIALHAA